MYAKSSESRKTPPVRPNKPKKTRSQRETWTVYGGGALLAILAFLVTYQFVEPAPPKTLTIAAGNPDGAYYAYARAFQTEFEKHGLTLTIRETSGSVENLKLLTSDTEDVALAFVQSGTAEAYQDSPLLGLASVYLEPVWVFSRTAFPSGQLADLRGKSLAIGADGSGTQAIARQILNQNRLMQAVTPLTIGSSAAADALEAGEIDAMISVASSESAVIQRLLNNEALQLLSFRRADAYAKHYGFLSTVSLPQGAVDLAGNIPPADISLIAPAATLVAHEELHPALSDLVLQVADSLFSGSSMFAQEGQFPSAELMDFPLSPEAERYYKSGPPLLQQFLPFWAATLIDRLKVLLLPLLALLLPLSKILPPTYRWSVRKKIYNWYEELQQVDQSASEIPTEKNLELCLARLDKIETEVREVEVPLGYAHELYILRQHIDLLARQIAIEEKLLEQQRTGTTA